MAAPFLFSVYFTCLESPSRNVAGCIRSSCSSALSEMIAFIIGRSPRHAYDRYMAADYYCNQQPDRPVVCAAFSASICQSNQVIRGTHRLVYVNWKRLRTCHLPCYDEAPVPKRVFSVHWSNAPAHVSARSTNFIICHPSWLLND